MDVLIDLFIVHVDMDDIKARVQSAIKGLINVSWLR